MSQSFAINIRKLYVSSAFEWMLFYIPIISVFYTSIGLSTRDMFIMQTIFMIVIAIAEVPTGYLADMMGRKKTLILGGICSLIGTIVYSMAHGFWGVAAAEVFLGLGASLDSGVADAIMYDSLVNEKNVEDFHRKNGILGSVGQISEGISSVIGGALAGISLRLPFYAQIVTVAIGIVIAATLHEPAREMPARNHAENARKFMSLMRKEKSLIWFMILTGIIVSTTFATVWYSQAFYVAVGIPVTWLGVIWAIGNLSSAAGGVISHLITKKYGEAKTILAIIAIVAGSLLWMGLAPTLWAIIATWLIRCVWAILSPLGKNIVNQIVPSSLRTTFLSAKSLTQRLIFILIGPIYGWIVGAYSLSTSLITAAIVLIIGSGITFAMVQKYKGLDSTATTN